ncbi:NAD-dependent epimerase/dehydratase family protein, partial [Mycobacterium tuberculosis]|nr:NAD-dependent epimerase/dehydratase family protein [Mycobacterium tuberculosis]
LPIVIARPFNSTGVGQSDAYLLPKLVAHYARSAPRLSLGNLDVSRDFSDVRDVTAAYLKLVEAAPEAPGGQLLRIGDMGVIYDGELFIVCRIEDWRRA